MIRTLRRWIIWRRLDEERLLPRWLDASEVQQRRSLHESLDALDAATSTDIEWSPVPFPLRDFRASLRSALTAEDAMVPPAGPGDARAATNAHGARLRRGPWHRRGQDPTREAPSLEAALAPAVLRRLRQDSLDGEAASRTRAPVVRWIAGAALAAAILLAAAVPLLLRGGPAEPGPVMVDRDTAERASPTLPRLRPVEPLVTEARFLVADSTAALDALRSHLPRRPRLSGGASRESPEAR